MIYFKKSFQLVSCSAEPANTLQHRTYCGFSSPKLATVEPNCMNRCIWIFILELEVFLNIFKLKMWTQMV